jgi:hypothetical protein
LLTFPEATIRKLGGWLVTGKGLRESIEKALMSRRKAPLVVTEEEQGESK